MVCACSAPLDKGADVGIKSTNCRRRLIRDFKRLSTDPPGGVSGSPCPDNIMLWNAVIFGPGQFITSPDCSFCFDSYLLVLVWKNNLLGDTPFEDGTFKLLLTFDESYPNKPPSVKFLSRMFHPNIYANGELCLDILQNRWSPTYDVAAILTSIQSLLHDPNPNSPANAEAAQLYRENMKEYARRVKATVEESWLDPEELKSVGGSSVSLETPSAMSVEEDESLGSSSVRGWGEAKIWIFFWDELISLPSFFSSSPFFFWIDLFVLLFKLLEAWCARFQEYSSNSLSTSFFLSFLSASLSDRCLTCSL